MNVAIVINEANVLWLAHLRLTHSQIIPDMNLVEMSVGKVHYRVNGNSRFMRMWGG